MHPISYKIALSLVSMGIFINLFPSYSFARNNFRPKIEGEKANFALPIGRFQVSYTEQKVSKSSPFRKKQVTRGKLLGVNGHEQGHFTFVQINQSVQGHLVAQGKLYHLQNSQLREIDPASFPSDENDTLLPGYPDLSENPEESFSPLTQESETASFLSLSSRDPIPVEPVERVASHSTLINPIAIATTLDLLMVYTPEARIAAGGSEEDIQALMELSVELANESFQNSGIAVKLRLVHSEEVDYDEENDIADLTRLQKPNDGYMDDIHELRDQYQADLVSLVANMKSYCGLSYVLDHPENEDFEYWAFSSVNYRCAASNLSLAHEIGHNVGMAHNRENAQVAGAFAYSFGHQFLVEGVPYRTVMAYQPGMRIPYYSSPDVYYLGVPTGSPEQNNALTLAITRFLIKDFR